MSAMKRKPVSVESALAQAESLCARSEHCSGEIRDRLWRKGIRGQQAETIIDSLIDRRFVDDERFARAFVHDKVNFARWGRRKIALAMAAKHLDRDTITDALESIDPDIYNNNLRSIIKLKISQGIDASVYENRQRLLRFAVSRGYEPSLVMSVLQQLDDDSSMLQS